MRGWYETYSAQGLVVIGNHYPEFNYEHDLGNLRAALTRLDVPYAVAQDNDGATWRAFGTRYWPTLLLIDKQGRLRYRHIGEGGYDVTEQAIQELLKETFIDTDDAPEYAPPLSLSPSTTLNVYSGAGTLHSIIGAIAPGEAFVVRGEENGWYRIGYNDGEGYVSGEYVTLSP